jgi:hypothetical protein
MGLQARVPQPALFNATKWHPIQTTMIEWHRRLLGPAWAFGVETGTHALRLITSGLFYRFPDLQMVIGHLGEGLVPMMARTQRRFEYASFDKKLKKPLSQYLKDHFDISTSAIQTNPLPGDGGWGDGPGLGDDRPCGDARGVQGPRTAA